MGMVQRGMVPIMRLFGMTAVLPPDVTVLDVSAVEVSSECVECSIPPLKIAPGLN